MNINLFRLFPPKYRLFFESVVLFSRNTEIQSQWVLFPRNTIYFSESVDVISPKCRLFFKVSGCQYFPFIAPEIMFIFRVSGVVFQKYRNSESVDVIPRNTIYFSESVDVISPKYRLFFRVSGCYFTEIPFIFQS